MEITDTIKEKIRGLRWHAEEAVGDIAYEAVQGGDGWGFEGKIAKLRKAGVRDLGGALADDLFNDAGIVADITGDRLYELLTAEGWKWEDEDTWNAAVTVLCNTLPHVSTGLRKALAR